MNNIESAGKLNNFPALLYLFVLSNPTLRYMETTQFHATHFFIDSVPKNYFFSPLKNLNNFPKVDTFGVSVGVYGKYIFKGLDLL